MAGIPYLALRPGERNALEVEVGPIMRRHELISRVSDVVIEGLTVDEISHTDTVVTFRAAGGTAGVQYLGRMQFETTGPSPPQELEALFYVRCLPSGA